MTYLDSIESLSAWSKEWTGKLVAAIKEFWGWFKKWYGDFEAATK